jgi:hypothetical protein
LHTDKPRKELRITLDAVLRPKLIILHNPFKVCHVGFLALAETAYLPCQGYRQKSGFCEHIQEKIDNLKTRFENFC